MGLRHAELAGKGFKFWAFIERSSSDVKGILDLSSLVIIKLSLTMAWGLRALSLYSPF